MTIFDHLKNLFTKEKKWCDMTEADRKEFTVFMINKFLSMDMSLTPLVNMIQEYTYGLSSELVFQLYFDILPYQKGFWTKYIKGQKESKYNPKLIELLSEYYQVSHKEIDDMLNLKVIDNRYIIEKYGFSSKEVDKIMKISHNEK